VNEPEIASGDSGEWVVELQTRLSALDRYAGALDGQYGEQTEAAVLKLQTENGLTADGRVGAQTWAALGAAESASGRNDNAPSAQEDGQHALGELTEDQQWRWGHDGWEPAHNDGAPAVAQGEASAAGHVSPDGAWRWDGSRWQPVVG
jgi:hypothetical protein